MSSMPTFFEQKCCKPPIMIQCGSHLPHPRDRARADAQVVAGFPDHIRELLNIQVAHFEPVAVSLVGEGVYPALALTLPRAKNWEYDQVLTQAQDSLRAAQLKTQPAPR